MPDLLAELLFDESLPHPIRDLFDDHLSPESSITFVQEQGWDSYDNGDLLATAQEKFDCLITADTSIQSHTDLSQYDIGVIILHGRTNRLEDLSPLVPQAVKKLNDIQSGESQTVSYENT